MKKIISFLLALIIVSTALPAFKADYALAAESYTMYAGDSLTLKPYSTSGKTLASYNWISNSPYDVEIVSQSSSSCVIKAKKATSGTVVINFNYYYYITSGSYTYQAQGADAFYITVEDIDAVSISLPTSYTVTEGSSFTLTPVLTPSNASSALTWQSNDVLTAVVDENGVVTAVNPGTATITVTTDNGLSADCKVTVQAAALYCAATLPRNNAVNVDSKSTITLTYNTYLLKGTNFEDITLTNNTTGENVEIDTVINGKKLVITPKAELKAGHCYTVTVPASGLQNYSNSPLSDKTILTFTTKAVELLNSTPAHESENISISSIITAEFDTALYQGTAFADIVLTNKSTGDAVESRVEINDAILTVTPASVLDYSTQYELVIPKGAVKNSDNSENTNSYCITFTTKAPMPEMTDSFPAANSVDCFADTEITVYFDMDISRGSEFDNISLADHENKAVTGKTEINGNVLTLTPLELLKYNTTYRLTIPKGAVVNSGSDANSDRLTISFTTGDALIGDTAIPVISPQNGRIGRDDTITLDCSDTDAKIYYTTDGSNPLENGQLYTNGFKLCSDEKTVRCIALKDGIAGGEARADYEFYYVPSEAKALFGGSGGDGFTAIAAAQNGWVVCGYSEYNSFGTGIWEDTESHGDADAFIIKYSSDGSIEWKKSFGGSANDFFYGIAAAEDGYIAVGTSEKGSFNTGDWAKVYAKCSYSYEYDATIVKFDLQGNILWKKNYNTSGDSFAEFYDVTVTNDGGYAASGYRSSSDLGGCLILVKYSSTGAAGWVKAITSVCNMHDSKNGFEAVITDGSHIIAAGEANENLYIAKYAADSGSFNWGKSLSNHSTANERIYDITKAEDGYIAVGYSEELNFDTGSFAGIKALGGNDAVILKYDTSGNVVWIRNFGSSGNDYFYGVTADEDGFVAVGSVTSDNGSDAVAVKYDASGNILWKKILSGPGTDIFKGITATEEGYIACGNIAYQSFGNGDFSDIAGYGLTDGIIVKFSNAVTDIIKGDINNDGTADSADAAAVLRYISNMDILTTEQKEIANINNDNSIDLKDVILILRQ